MLTLPRSLAVLLLLMCGTISLSVLADEPESEAETEVSQRIVPLKTFLKNLQETAKPFKPQMTSVATQVEKEKLFAAIEGCYPTVSVRMEGKLTNVSWNDGIAFFGVDILAPRSPTDTLQITGVRGFSVEAPDRDVVSQFRAGEKVVAIVELHWMPFKNKQSLEMLEDNEKRFYHECIELKSVRFGPKIGSFYSPAHTVRVRSFEFHRKPFF